MYLTGCKYRTGLDLTSVLDTSIVQICAVQNQPVHGHLNVEWLFQNQVMNVLAVSGSVTLLKHDFLSIYDMSTNVLFPMF